MARKKSTRKCKQTTANINQLNYNSASDVFNLKLHKYMQIWFKIANGRKNHCLIFEQNLKRERLHRTTKRVHQTKRPSFFSISNKRKEPN